ncbi:MAG: hypothetical protein QM811_16735 [Pirellulales bacterium]
MNLTIIDVCIVLAILGLALLFSQGGKLGALLASFRNTFASAASPAVSTVGDAATATPVVELGRPYDVELHAFEALLTIRDRLVQSLADEFVNQLLAPILPHLVRGPTPPTASPSTTP